MTHVQHLLITSAWSACKLTKKKLLLQARLSSAGSHASDQAVHVGWTPTPTSLSGGSLQPAATASFCSVFCMLKAVPCPSPFDAVCLLTITRLWSQFAIAGLRTLRLGLSGIRCLALDLPKLATLDVTGASKLQCLELRCPSLLTAYFKTCR